MTMETYLAKMFNHGGAVVNIFAWGVGGEAMKNMDFRVVTEVEEALQAYRKFLKGDPLEEAKTEALTLMERLPPKLHQIQKELPAWIQKTGNREAAALMQKLQVTDEQRKQFMAAIQRSPGTGSANAGGLRRQDAGPFPWRTARPDDHPGIWDLARPRWGPVSKFVIWHQRLSARPSSAERVLCGPRGPRFHFS
jgi:hypothetical protein